MEKKKMPPLQIDDIEARVPIVQGGMSVGISLGNLASAVANAGGIGVIGAAGLGAAEPDISTNWNQANKRALQREIRMARKVSKGLIGMNIMMALSDYDTIIQTTFDEGVDILFVGAGLFLRMPDSLDMDELKEQKTKIIPIVSSEKGARIMFNYWAKNYDHVPDGVVVEGPLAGGHLGFTKEMIEDPQYALESIVPEVISTIEPFREKFEKDIPVIPAGGIYTGADIYKFMKMGASGVQMATRFVATHECDASYTFKETYLNAKKEDVKIIQSPVGMPGRAINNKFLESVSKGDKIPFHCGWKCLRTCNYKEAPYCIALALTHAKWGMMGNGFAFAGANVHRVNKIVKVQELIDELVDGYEEAANADL
ncbi:MAG: nitronate monooxygenase [Candidatus Thermoplasmatota archaeon]|nr:nitronate monooxygenase [Candidatus Thermoplasmatota archaeon]